MIAPTYDTIVSTRKKYNIGAVVYAPVLTIDSNGNRNTNTRPTYIVARATFKEYFMHCVEKCGPPPKHYVPDIRGLHFYKVSYLKRRG